MGRHHATGLYPMSSQTPRYRPRSPGGRLRRLRGPGMIAALAVVWTPTFHDADQPAGAESPRLASVASYRELDLDATSLRDCDLEPRSAEASRGELVVRGLAAYACDQPEEAVELLTVSDAPGDALEDWRLLALAESALAAERIDTAVAAAEALARVHAASPLRDRAVLTLARVDHQAGQLERALRRARESRLHGMSPAVRLDLDILAWETAVELERSVDVEQEAAYLLLHQPLDAFDLEVSRSLEDDRGGIDWRAHFEPRELLIRAGRLIEVDLREEALETLSAVEPASRDVDWYLLQARALVEERRGREALEALAGVDAPDEATLLETEWLRALAALDAATARRGRVNLPSAERQEMRQRAREHLAIVIARGGDSARAVDALRRLFEDLADGEHFEQVYAILTRLRRVDPDDTTGEHYLWQLGWGEYDRRNYSGAIGYWSELAALYPESKLARSGHYWSARAHEALGNLPRAERLLEEIAATPVTDYYSKHALARLGRLPRPERAPPPPAPRTWPTDPLLERAELLTELGVDALGLEEVEALDAIAERRAAEALKSRILARLGRRRDSIQSLWRVFPVLGTADQIAVPGDALEMYYPLDFVEVIERHAEANRLGVPLLLAMVRQESAFDVSARSHAGARGLMQVMPATGRELAERMGLPFSPERLNDPDFSVRLGSRYFRQVLDMFDDNLEIALAGYNAGPYRIKRLLRSAGSEPETDRFVEGLPLEESKTYVKRIVLFSDSYARLYPHLG